LRQDDVRYFGWITTDVSRLMRTVFDRRVRSLGLTRPQWLALTRLHRRPGASQSELAEMMEIEKAPAGRIIDRLEEKRWIERCPDPADRRINRIYLTDRGQRLHAAILPIAERTVTDALSGLSAAERRQATKLMSRVKATLARLAEADAASGSIDLAEIDNDIDKNTHIEERPL
jgi:DNA-binding MarR family transcriptional regulator